MVSLHSTFAADSVLIGHVIYVAIVVLAVPLIVAGGLRGWKWVHARIFRLTHLAMIVVVALESLFGVRCPLTLWERSLRGQDGNVPSRDFIAVWLDQLLFWQFPHWVFTSIYTAFAVGVVSLFYFVPLEPFKPHGRRMA